MGGRECDFGNDPERGPEMLPLVEGSMANGFKSEKNCITLQVYIQVKFRPDNLLYGV